MAAVATSYGVGIPAANLRTGQAARCHAQGQTGEEQVDEATAATGAGNGYARRKSREALRLARVAAPPLVFGKARRDNPPATSRENQVALGGLSSYLRR